MFTLAAFPQQSSQTVAGIVLATDGEAIPGATIVLTPGALRTRTDSHGTFALPAVAAGEYTLRVTYIGMRPSSTRVEVDGRPLAALKVVLRPGGLSQAVTVTATAGQGMRQSVNVERSAPNEIDSLSARQIRALPNANVADALQRLPGVAVERDEGEGKYVEVRGTAAELSNVTVDGVDIPAPETGIRQMKLDVIPADLVSAVQVSKTLQANMEGDAIGGTVNLVTRSAGPHPHVSVLLNGGHTPIDTGRAMALGSLTAEDSFGAGHTFGAVVTLSDDYNSRGIDDVEPVPDLVNGTLWDDAADFRQYLYTRHRYGVGGSLTDTIGTNDSVFFRYLYSDFFDTGLETIYSLNTNQVLDGVNNTNTPSASNSERFPDYAIGSVILGGEHASPSSHSWLRWQLSASRSRTLHPQFSSGADWQFNNSTSNCQFDPSATANPYLPQFTSACFAEAYNQSNYSMADYQDGSNGLNAKLNLAGKVDAARYYHAGPGIGTIQWGGQVRNDHQFDNSYVATYTPNGTIPMNLFQTSYTNTHYYNGQYTAGPWSSFAMTKNYVLAHPGLFSISSDQGQDPADYDLTSLISAAYLMNTYTVGDYTLYGGVRVEQTDVHTLSMDTSVAPALYDVHGGANYLSLLPSASLTRRLNGASDIRVAYFRGIARPQPFDLSTAVNVDITTNPWTYSVGNPALQPEMADDVDVMYERYFSTVGTFRASYFYKYIGSPIVTQQTIPTAGTYAGFRLDQPTNAGHAWVNGIELEFQQRFSTLPGALSGLGLLANYTWTASRAYDVNPAYPGNPGRTDNPPLQRQTPNTWNLMPTYSWTRFFGSFGISYNGPNINSYNYQAGANGGLTGPFGDVYVYPHTEVDAQFKARIAPAMSLELNGLNLINEPFGFYQGSPQYDIQREYYSPTYEFGIRFTWKHES